MKRLAISALVAVTLSGAHRSASAVLVDRIVATVDGDPITTFEITQYRDKSLRGRQLPPGTDAAGVLDSLITDKIMQKEASEKGIIVRDEDVDRSIDLVKERNHINDEQFKQALAQQGVSLEEYRAQLRDDLVRQQLVTRELRNKVSVSPEDVQRYYDAHKEQYGSVERVHLAQIVLELPVSAPPESVAAVTVTAEELRARLKKGEDFAAMAAKYSTDKTGAQGGDLGWFKRGELLDSMETAIADLKDGEISAPVRTRMGLHIIKVVAREGAGSDAMAAHSDEIKQQLYSEALETRFQKLMTEELRARHHVEMK